MAGNPILTYLPLNGTLAGTDRNGAFTATGSGALRWQPAEGARVNYVGNSRFANNASGWNAQNGATLTRLTTDPERPTCVEVTTNGTFNGQFYGNTLNTSAARTGPGQRITISYDIKHVSGSKDVINTGNGLGVDMTYLGGVGTGIESGNLAPLLVTDEWVRVSRRYDTNYECAALVVVCHSASVFRIANIVIEIADFSSPPSYFDGSSTGASWFDPRTGQLGTAHASPSCEQLTAWVEEGTTNLLSNPGVEAATLGSQITAWVGATISKDTKTAYMGTSSVKVVTPGVAVREGVAFVGPPTGLGFTGIRTHRGSIYVRGSGVVDVYTRWQFSDLTVFDSTPVTVTLTNAWQRIVANSHSTDGTKTVDYVFIFVRTSTTVAPQAVTFYCDCAQVEEKAYATSYCDGSLGTGYSWAGTAHASTSTRVAGSISVAASGRAYESDGAAIVKFSRLLNKGSQHSELLALGNYLSSPAAGQASQRLILDPVTNKLVSTWSLNGAAYNAALYSTETFPTIASWYKAYTAWTVSAQKVSSLAGTPVSTSKASPTGTFVTNINIGWNSLGTNYTDGLLGPVALYDAPLSDARRALVNTAIDNYDDLWSLFEEWDAQIQPVDLLALQSGQATAGVTADAQPYDLLALQSGQATAGVAAEVDALDMSMMGEELVATARRPFPYLVTWRSP